MKKNSMKLSLSKVTLANLSREEEARAMGGATIAALCTQNRVCGFSRWDCDTLTFDVNICM